MTLDPHSQNVRRWLVAAYLLAAVVAPCAHHHHGPESESAATRCLASCQDARLHLSGHESPSLDPPADDCLACQFRATHQVVAATTPDPFDARRGGPVVAFEPPAIRRTAALLLSCRAPPLV